MDETREEQEELAQDERDADELMREQDVDEWQGREWEAFHNDLRVRRPVSERRLPMADHEV